MHKRSVFKLTLLFIILIQVFVNELVVNCFILQVNCIIFDKTGTLTIGKPMVVDTRLFKTMVPQEFYELIAAAEVGSNLVYDSSSERSIHILNKT